MRLWNRTHGVSLNRRNFNNTSYYLKNLEKWDEWKRFKIFCMPPISWAMTHGTINRWYIKKGDILQPYQLVVEISPLIRLDKSSQSDVQFMEIELVEDDMEVRSVLYEEGKTVPVGWPILILCDELNNTRKKSESEWSEKDILGSKDKIAHAIWQGYTKKT